MPDRTFQSFLRMMFKTAIDRCGNEFARKVNYLRQERERLLKNRWRQFVQDELPPARQQEIFREIDFDTIVIHAARYLKEDDYLAFLYDIAEIGTEFRELQKAQRLLYLIVKEHRHSVDILLRAKTHQKLGDIAFYQDHFALARREYCNSLNQYNLLADNQGIAWIKNSLGIVMIEVGKSSEAESLFMEAKKLAKKGDFSPLLVEINFNLGNLYRMRGSWGEAMAYYKDALAALGRKRDDTRARIYHGMAIIAYVSWKKYADALEYLHKSIKFSTDANDFHQKGLSYLEKAKISCHIGDLQSAETLSTAAFKIFSESGDRLGMAEVYKIFGMINRESKRHDIALSYFENSLRINHECNKPLNIGETLYELAQLYVETRESNKAVENLKSASNYFEQSQAKAKLEEVQRALASIGN